MNYFCPKRQLFVAAVGGRKPCLVIPRRRVMTATAVRRARAAEGETPTTPLTRLGVKLVVFDMAGTTVDEGGIVYTALKGAMKEFGGLDVNDEEFDRWHGANKKEVVQHFVDKEDGTEKQTEDIYAEFERRLQQEYFAVDTPLRAMPGILEYFDALRKAGIKVGLNTGFPRGIADHIIKQLGFKDHIDASCVAMEVGAGRPCPYMIFSLMRSLNVQSVFEVAKVGDTVRDVEEGLNAGTPYVYGVLTGADQRDALQAAGAFGVVNSAVEIPI